MLQKVPFLLNIAMVTGGNIKSGDNDWLHWPVSMHSAHFHLFCVISTTHIEIHSQLEMQLSFPNTDRMNVERGEKIVWVEGKGKEGGKTT